MYKENLLTVHRHIGPFIHKTPLLTSQLLDEMMGTKLFFKCENFQKAGSFKIRGATNAIMQLSDVQRKNGVVTHSSGNFAQALSLAAKNLEVPAYIVMPSNAPQVKKDAIKGYGGEIIECESNLLAREQTASKIQQEKGAVFIHPSNDMDVILGQGTATIEMLEDEPNIDYIFCSVGGGGLIAGTALATLYYGPNCKIIGGEPFEVDDAYRSLLSGNIESNRSTNTIADGLRTRLGELNFPIIKNEVSKIIRVTENEIIEAMQLIWERLKIVCEPSSAVALAALIKEKQDYKKCNVGIILSGGNVDLSKLPF